MLSSSSSLSTSVLARLKHTDTPSFDSPLVEDKYTADSIYTQSPGGFMDTLVDLSQVTPRSFRRVPTGHTELFWDPPSLFTKSAARMVPSTSHKPYSIFSEASIQPTSIPEKFDFGMYDLSASRAGLIDFIDRDLPPDATAVFDASLYSVSTPTAAYLAHRRQVAIRSTHFANKAALQDQNASSKARPFTELNLPASQLTLRLKNLDSKHSSLDILSDGWDLVSSEDIEQRLRTASGRKRNS
ncbi:hypothetical protein DXG03_003081 [Asterophora parasitica]|uniref:Uncharacterized protein n=1 Tax=Asterophora parasitica TaxID=117018 RepID=A0A9P7GFP6_9AGAR|nr:hypothetical protein DXG03_003081 [Asterophora parasitica]